MGNLKSVVIIDDDAEFRAKLTTLINSHPDFEVIAKALGSSDGKLYIEFYQPDVIVLDIIMPEEDGVKLIKDIYETYNDYQPYIYVMTAVNTSSMRLILEALDIDYVEFKPIVDKNVINTLNRILSDTAKTNTKKNYTLYKKDMADVIDNTLVKLGVPPHLSGFLCIKTALYFILDNPNSHRKVYQAISTTLNTTRNSVDNNLRTAIEACMDSDLYQTLFGKHKTSNLIFLHKLALYVKQQIRGSKDI